MESVKDSIDKKLESIGSGDGISSKLIKELGESATIIEELEAEVESLKKTHTADTIRMKEMRELIKSMKSNSRNLRECLQDARIHSSHLEEDILLMTNQSSEDDQVLESLRKQVSNLKSENKSLKYKNSMLESRASKASDLSGQLTESKKKAAQNSTLYEDARREIGKLKTELSESSKAIDTLKKTEKNLNAKLKSVNGQNASLIKENKAYKSRYVQMKAVQCGFSSETIRARLPENYSITDVDRVVSELSDKKDRIGKVPVAIPVSGITYKESTMPEFIDEESSQTIRMLEAFKKSNN